LYSGGPDRLYNQFYAALQGWRRYQLVTNPAESDLVPLRVSFSNPFTGENSPTGNQRGGRCSVSDPQFRLTIIDPTTRVTLWTFTEHVQSALLSGNRDKNFDQALDALVNDLKKRSWRSQPPRPAPTDSSGFMEASDWEVARFNASGTGGRCNPSPSRSYGTRVRQSEGLAGSAVNLSDAAS